GIIKESGLKKFNAMLKSDYNFFNDRVKVELLLLGAHVEQASAPIGNNSSTDGSLISQALQWNPTRPLFEDGDFLQPGGVEANPLALLKAYDDQFVMNRIIASVKPTINIAKNLDYSVQIGIDHTHGTREASLKKFYLINSAPNLGQAYYGTMVRTSEQISNTLSWKKDFNTIKLNALLGYEYLRIRVDGKNLTASNFTSDDIDFVKVLQNAPAANTGMSSVAPPDNKLQSFFGRADLNYQDKFLLTATLRADGSSKFGENNRYAMFPSFGFGWNMHEFGFVPESINRLKLRLGWGETGNQQFPEGSATERWAFGSGGGSSTLFQTNVGNPNLRWETTRTINMGLDIELFQSRLAATIDVFDKKTEDIIFFMTTPQPGPAVNYWTNFEDSYIKNTGLELTLDGWIIENSNLKWQLGVNATFLKNSYESDNDVTLLTGTISGKGLSGVTTQVITKGQPLYTYKLREWTGIGEDGFSTYEGFDDVSQSSPKYFSGDPLPDMLLGISSTVTVGNFDATINFNGAFGHQIYNNTANAIFIKGNLGTRNTSRDLIGNGEDVANVSAASTRFLEDADFIRLANLSVGYTIKPTGVFKKMRVYLTGQNLAVFTNYSGFDPEVNTDKNFNGVPSYGIEYTPYPRSRSFIAGVTASF
ncbi:MAG TPA: TonB-dependent receptor, partial [Ohtaekwangia sp.]